MRELLLAARLARRELRSGLSGFRLFLACLAIGVFATAAVGSLQGSIDAGIRTESRALLGGDIDLQLYHQPPTGEQEAFLSARSAARSRIVEMRAMVRPVGDRDRRTLVELKAVDEHYPLVGAVQLEPAGSLQDSLAFRDGRWGAVAAAGLLERQGLQPGDLVRVGEATVEIRARLVREPDQVASVFNLGPRLMVAAGAVGETGLVQPGSLVHYHNRVLLPPGTATAAWIDAVKAAFPTAAWRIRDASGAAPGIRRFVERMNLFLSFVALSTLLIAGIGVGNAVKAYLDGKTSTIATFRCLGARPGLIFRIYLVQIAVLAALAIAVGGAAGALVPALAIAALQGVLPIPAQAGLHVAPLALAGLFGGLTALTFALWPLARVRAVAAADLFRLLAVPLSSRPGLKDTAVVAGLAAVLAALVVLTSSDRWFAAWFVAGTCATLLVLRGGAAVVMAAARRVGRFRTHEVRMAVANLHRPATATPVVMVSLGAGMAVLVAIALIEGNIRARIGERLPDAAPALFFIDIQDDQTAAFDETVLGVEGVERFRRVPSVRGGIVAINGVPVERATVAPEAQWAVRGDRGLTYARGRPEEAKLVAGDWWPSDYRGPPLVSLDAGLAEGFGVGLGDTLTLNVLGRQFVAEIASLREIDWGAIPFDFALILAPGTLEGAPHSHIAAVFVSERAETAVERAVAGRLPNVSAIRVRDALAAVNRLVAAVGDGIRLSASATLVVGALVLAGAIIADRRRRTRDAVLFKVLGATRSRIAAIFLFEYAALGLCTGAAAALVGSIAAWAVTVLMMHGDWVFLPRVVAATVLGSIATTAVIGFSGTWRALGQKALPHLRNE